ncbi:MAG: Helix-turn-helix domain [Acidobacteria bacterium]|nr:Helix-turn-helix domain [Acidobacteriota bacterium]
MVGDNLRQARLAQHLSLATVAGEAHISAATLSRIETNKQPLELRMFMTLAGVLKVSARELLGSEGEAAAQGSDPLVTRIAGLETSARTELWRGLAAERRSHTGNNRSRNMSNQLDELLAQVEFLREEIESVRSRLRKRK